MTQNAPLSVRTLAIAAPSLLKALRLMREQLGQDAIILSSSMNSAGVEIVASLETPGDCTQANVVSLVLSEQPCAILPLPCVSLPVAVDARIGDTSVLREIHSMRGMIEEQLAGLAWNKTQRRDPLRGQLMRTMLGAGFSARLARDLLANLPAGLNNASGLDYLRSAMAIQMPVLEDEDVLMHEGGVYALMGPTGVGKTTTTAKLAARCVLRFGAAKLALITTDTYRIGAYEQLRIYGQILGVTVHAVKDVGDLETVLASLKDKHMVLIDTVGMSQRDRAVSDQIAMLSGVSRPVKRLLLLNAASHGDTLNEVVQAYRQAAPAHDSIGLAGCILTKVDEATHPGAVIDIVIRHQLPVHYVSSGQKVPEHLMLGDRKSLIDSAFEARGQSSMFIAGEAELEEPTADRGDNAKVVAAEAVSDRLRLQCQQLINTLAHNAKELTSSATALSAADIGFGQTRELWRQLSAPSMDEKQFLEAMLSCTKSDSQTTCKDYALAVTSLSSPQLPLIQGQSRRITALVSDRTGLPFAAIPLTPTDNPNPGSKQSCDTWLDGSDNKPLVYLFDSQSTAEQIQDWQFAGLRWVVSAPASLQVEGVPDSPLATLTQLASALVFSPAGTVVLKGRKACLSVAEMPVWLRADSRKSGSIKATTVRCVVRRIADANGHQIGQRYLLASPNILASPEQLLQWSSWRSDCVPYFSLLKQAVQQLETNQVPYEETGIVKLLVAGQVAITVFGLQQAQQGWAETARRVMAQLAGQALRADRPVPGRALIEGLGKLCVLLDALESGETASKPSMTSKQHSADGNRGNKLWTS